jgi:hypothetical protein
LDYAEGLREGIFAHKYFEEKVIWKFI